MLATASVKDEHAFKEITHVAHLVLEMLLYSVDLDGNIICHGLMR